MILGIGIIIGLMIGAASIGFLVTAGLNAAVGRGLNW